MTHVLKRAAQERARRAHDLAREGISRAGIAVRLGVQRATVERYLKDLSPEPIAQRTDEDLRPLFIQAASEGWSQAAVAKATGLHPREIAPTRRRLGIGDPSVAQRRDRIMALHQAGRSVAQIATEMRVNPNFVRTVLRSIYPALRVKSGRPSGPAERGAWTGLRRR